MSRDVRLPGTIWRPLPENGTQGLITPRIWIVHTAVDGSGPTNLGGYFERADVRVESHTWLRWDRHEQLMSLDVRADANYLANPFAASTETEDDGSPVAHPWNGYQVGELVNTGVFMHQRFGIPPEYPKTWNGTGMGYHSLYPNHWTNVAGKTCPGSTRIEQFRDDVLPRIKAAITGEDDAVKDQIAWYKDAAGKPHAYRVVGLHGKWLSGASLNLCKYLGIPEANTAATAFDATWQGTTILVDGPLANVKAAGSAPTAFTISGRATAA